MVVGKKNSHQGAGLFGDLIFALWPWSDTGPLGPLVSFAAMVSTLFDFYTSVCCRVCIHLHEVLKLLKLMS